MSLQKSGSGKEKKGVCKEGKVRYKNSQTRGIYKKGEDCQYGKAIKGKRVTKGKKKNHQHRTSLKTGL